MLPVLHIQHACALLATHLHQPPTVTQLARALATNRTTLRHSFKNYCQETIREYHTRLRMEKAQALLREESLSVQAIGELVGYTAANNFTAAFKHCYGITPQAFREAAR